MKNIHINIIFVWNKADVKGKKDKLKQIPFNQKKNLQYDGILRQLT